MSFLLSCCCKVSAAGAPWLLWACTQGGGDPRERPGMGSTLPPAHRVRPLLPEWVGGHDWSGVSEEGQWKTPVRKDQDCFYFHVIPFWMTYTVIAPGFVSGTCTCICFECFMSFFPWTVQQIGLQRKRWSKSKYGTSWVLRTWTASHVEW